jgi:tetratricopeptide (TPR) repeat protein
MADKKKVALSKMNEGRVNSPETLKTSKTAEAARGGRTATVPQAANAERQLASFETAMKLFHARKLKDALAHFLQAAEGPERDVAQRARLHVAMCERRLQQTDVSLRTAEDYYNYAIALLNTRQIDQARTHLERALEMAPDADHVFYALAVAQALSGDATGAHDYLKRAIELEPKNRLMARQDGDFASVGGQAPFQALLYPEKKSNW